VNNETISLGEVCGVDVVVYAGGLGPAVGGGDEPCEEECERDCEHGTENIHNYNKTEIGSPSQIELV